MTWEEVRVLINRMSDEQKQAPACANEPGTTNLVLFTGFVIGSEPKPYLTAD